MALLCLQLLKMGIPEDKEIARSTGLALSMWKESFPEHQEDQQVIERAGESWAVLGVLRSPGKFWGSWVVLGSPEESWEVL